MEYVVAKTVPPENAPKWTVNKKRRKKGKVPLSLFVCVCIYVCVHMRVSFFLFCCKYMVVKSSMLICAVCLHHGGETDWCASSR